MKQIIADRNPYSYNSVVQRQTDRRNKPTPTANQLLMDPTVNSISKFLGVDKKEWNQFADKVSCIVQWAREKTGSDDPNYLTLVIKEKLATSPALSDRRINDVYYAVKLEENGRNVKQDYNGNSRQEVEN